jgi:hypothetical protein
MVQIYTFFPGALPQTPPRKPWLKVAGQSKLYEILENNSSIESALKLPLNLNKYNTTMK